jgi:hypothetical protein
MVTVAVLLLASTVALADRDTHQSHFDRGRALLAKGKLAGASAAVVQSTLPRTREWA